MFSVPQVAGSCDTIDVLKWEEFKLSLYRCSYTAVDPLLRLRAMYFPCCTRVTFFLFEGPFGDNRGALWFQIVACKRFMRVTGEYDGFHLELLCTCVSRAG